MKKRGAKKRKGLPRGIAEGLPRGIAEGLPRGIAGCCHSCHKGGVCKSSKLGKALRKKR